jgi:hypothetical protein
MTAETPIYLRKRQNETFDGPNEGSLYSPGSMAGQPPPPDNGWGGMSTGLTISLTMLSGLLVWGGLGYLADRLAGTGGVFTVIGMLIGTAASTYLIYLRYGRENHDKR